jgi:20S proteasome subunit alpha 2
MSDVNFSLTTFSKNGTLLQIEYALNRVQNGKIALGIRAANGVVIVTDKKLPTPLIVNEDYHKIEMITPQSAFVYSGMGADYRVLVKEGRKIAQEYFLKYHEFIPIRVLVQQIAEVMQEYTQAGGVRPFGVSLLVAGGDERHSHLYQVDPSGTFFEWNATAIGKHFQQAKNFLERRLVEDDDDVAQSQGGKQEEGGVSSSSSSRQSGPSLDIDDCVHIALLTLRESFDGEMNEKNIEVAIYREWGSDERAEQQQHGGSGSSNTNLEANRYGSMQVLTEEEIADYLQEENV